MPALRLVGVRVADGVARVDVDLNVAWAWQGGRASRPAHPSRCVEPRAHVAPGWLDPDCALPGTRTAQRSLPIVDLWSWRSSQHCDRPGSRTHSRLGGLAALLCGRRSESAAARRL